MSRTFSKFLKAGGYVIAVLAIGGAGLLVGHLIQGYISPTPSISETLLTTGLKVDDAFPEVTLVTSEGDSSLTSDLLEAGGVVLFLDPECPPCTEMALRWQSAIEERLVENDWVIGVMSRQPERIDGYRTDNGITFRILYDPATVFRTAYNVQLVPYEVVVGASGQIRSTSRDRVSPVDIEALLTHFTE